MAAAGLWTTPSDLARFAIGIQQSLAGTSNPVISQNLTQQMLTDQKNGDGLGLFLQGKGSARRFTHDGSDECFESSMMAYDGTGQGAVIMVNANVSGSFMPHLLETIAHEYHWPEYPVTPTYSPIPDKEPAVTALIKSELEQMAAGKYNKDLYTAQLNAIIEAQVKGGLAEVVRGFGPLQSIELVERKNTGGNRLYRYRVTFKNVTLLAPCTFDKDNKISDLSLQPE
jgi:CubicO group peptidase (beta-lactamase class C family)